MNKFAFFFLLRTMPFAVLKDIYTAASKKGMFNLTYAMEPFLADSAWALLDGVDACLRLK